MSMVSHICYDVTVTFLTQCFMYNTIMHIDELSKQTVALKILGRCFAVRAGKDLLSYLYQEYDVSFNMNIVCEALYLCTLSHYRKLQTWRRFYVKVILLQEWY